MFIAEAIEILKGEPGPQFILEGKRAYEAAQLGVEALKVIKEKRGYPEYIIPRRLPGETE